jgi:carbon-monoxide dehydrogenase large subunit
VRSEFVNQRVAPAPMEPDGVLARVDDATGMLTVWASTQRVHQVRDAIANALGLGSDEVRAIAPQVGGGFGGKFEPAPEAVVVAALARRLGRAVAWTQTRSENLVGMPHGRGQLQRGALGLRRDGTFVGLWIDVLGDAGAYPIVGSLIPNATVAMAPGTYRFERAGGRGRSTVTNTTPMGAYRGAGDDPKRARCSNVSSTSPRESSASIRWSSDAAISCSRTRSPTRARWGWSTTPGTIPAASTLCSRHSTTTRSGLSNALAASAEARRCSGWVSRCGSTAPR